MTSNKTRRFQIYLSLTIIFFLFSSCSSPTLRYIACRLFPDRVQTQGNLSVAVKGLSRPVTILLDRFAVPHIRAANERDLYFSLGYMHGRDRRFQMETLKMLGLGRLREIIGDRDKSDAMIRLEVFSRMLGFYKDAERFVASLPAKDLAVLEAYCDGVNAATQIEPVAMEFRLLDYKPEVWKPSDTAAILTMISFGLAKNWEQELGRLELIIYQLQTGSSFERALKIWKPRSDFPPHLIGKKPKHDPFASIPVIAPELDKYLREFAKQPTKTSAAKLPNNPRGDTDDPLNAFMKGGSHSNNWAVSGKWTGTGKAAFSADPHLPHQMPPLTYLAHIKCSGCASGSFEAIGGSLIGLPVIIFGTNGRVAWGPTSNWADVTDLYVEKPVPNRPSHYYYEGREETFIVRNEVFRIRKHAKLFDTDVRSVRSSRHGVIVNDFIDRLPADFPIVALKRDYNADRSITALRNLYRSKNTTQARLALGDFTAKVGHWALADSAGNIAYLGSARLPKRKKHLGTVPVPGWIRDYEWDGFFSTDELPQIENPSDQFLGSANNQVIQPESFGWPINFEGDTAHRYARIAEILGAGNDKRLVIAQMKDLQRDNLDLGFDEVKPLYFKALKLLAGDKEFLVSKAASELLKWDGRCTPDSTAATIFNTLNALLIEKTLRDEMSDKTLEFVLTYFNIEPFIFGILADPSNPAWDDRRTQRQETAEETIRESFHDAVTALSKNYGSHIENWVWERTARFELAHPFASRKALRSYLNRGPLPTNGATGTVSKHQFMRIDMTSFPIKYGPVLRIIVDFADISGSIMSIPGGQSGRPSSKHYDDILPLYLDGKGVPIMMDFGTIEKDAPGRLTLTPKN